MSGTVHVSVCPQETSVAVQRLSDAVCCQASQFSFAGMKDRRAVTVQHMVVRGVTADRSVCVCVCVRVCVVCVWCVCGVCVCGVCVCVCVCVCVLDVPHHDSSPPTRLQSAAQMCGGGREEEGGPRLRCGGFSYVEGPLRMGDLWGNQFSIRVRGTKVSMATMFHTRPVLPPHGT